MAEIQGLFRTGDYLAELRKHSISDMLFRAFNDIDQVAFIVRGLKNAPVSDPEFRWFEQSLPANYVTVNNATGYGASATSLVVDDSSPVRKGTVLKRIASGEQMLVTNSDTSTNTITVKRGWGTTAATTIADNDILAIVGDANAEGGVLPAAITRQPVKKYNYTQIFREPVRLTETAAATQVWGGDPVKNQRLLALRVIKEKIEKAFLFGEPKEDTSTYTTPVRATGGLEYFIQTNVTNAGGALTETVFEDWVNSAFYKGERKMGFFSPLISTAVSFWAKNKLRMAMGQSTYGLAIKEYSASQGSLRFVTEKLLKENPTWNGYAFIVDMDAVGYRYLSGNGYNRDLKLRPNRQVAGEDVIAEEYLVECGLQLMDEERHALLKGVTSYS